MKAKQQPEIDPTAIPTLLENQSNAYQLDLKNRALSATAEGITISDPSQPDNPIIYANEGFERLTGYSRADVLGKNCRFLQGPETATSTVDDLRRAICENRPITVELLNYRKDGSKFWNRLSVTPVCDSDGNTTHFIGVQSDVTARQQAEEALRRTNEQLDVANKRMRDDLEAASRVQRSLLPAELPIFPGLKFAWEFRPCDELAGDFLNVIRLDDRHIALYVVDVAGHGVAASLLAVTIARLLTSRVSTSSLLMRQSKTDPMPRVISPKEVARELNRRFPMEEQNGLTFTILYGIVDLETLEFRFVSAGHDPIVHLPQGRDPVSVDAEGMTIGWLADMEFSESIVNLQRGDRIFICSDGVPEAMNKRLEQFSKERMLSVLTQCRSETLTDSVSSLLGAVNDWCGRQGPIDDVSILGLEVCEKD